MAALKEKTTAFIAGAFIITGLQFYSKSITENIVLFDPRSIVSNLFSALAIGTSTGHYIGLFLKNSDETINYFAMGIFSSLCVVFLYKIGITHLTQGMCLLGAGILFLHISNLVENYRHIEEYINFFAENVSS